MNICTVLHFVKIAQCWLCEMPAEIKGQWWHNFMVNDQAPIFAGILRTLGLGGGVRVRGGSDSVGEWTH